VTDYVEAYKWYSLVSLIFPEDDEDTTIRDKAVIGREPRNYSRRVKLN
jgi:hypothetical protein